MKNYLRYISLSMVFASLLLTSCDEDAPFEDPTYIGGYSYLADQNISVFDTNEDLTIDFFTDEGITINSVEVMLDGSSLTSATVSEDMATFNSSVFGDFQLDDEFDIMIESQLSNGNTAKDPFTVAVVKAIEVDDENPVELSLDSINNGAAIAYSTYTLSAPIDSAELFLKKNSDGTYSNSAAEVSTEGGEIKLMNTNYADLNLAVDDTLYYEFRATSGSMSQADDSYVVIIED
ncbi:hypothetical protein [Christiangramia crocea]|uniref:Uncharacterized protein n=1 Tax=Christiangramia crocea TaxID=2904124 RepID=A0A9X1UTQ6_9FLAO|nr:hypothetical protein [Gramella crocea]MCG9970137.1 hypothetical protein [Gramella crocea]